MKERPILFKSEMVQAILEGRKTMTRRVVKPQPDDDDNIQLGYYHPSKVDRQGELYPGPECYGLSNEHYSIKCPYGQPGDQLWVRETFRYYSNGKICYKADNHDRMPGWKPSIFMPREAARINLLIKSIRVERLRDISEYDAEKEGCVSTLKLNEDGDDYTGFYPSERFMELWESINGKGSWEKNPWVWVIEFERIEK